MRFLMVFSLFLLAMAVAVERDPVESPAAGLSQPSGCPCCDPLALLAQKLGIFTPLFNHREDSNSGRRGISATQPAILWSLALEPLKARHQGIRELADLFASISPTASLSAGETKRFKEQVNDIVRRHGNGLRLAWPDELDGILKNYRERGLIEAQRNLGTHGIVMPHRPYGIMIEEGIFPVMDIHDVMTHLPPFMLFPNYQALFVDRAKNIRRLEDIAKSSPQFNEQVDRAELAQLRAFIRYTTYEAVPLVLSDGSTPEFVFLGGHAYGLGILLADHFDASKDKKQTLDYMVKYLGFSQYPDHLDPFDIGNFFRSKRLPYWAQFAGEKGEAIKAFELAREARGQTTAGMREIEGRIRPILEKYFPTDAETKTETRQQVVDAVLAKMRKARVEIAADPVLAQRFSPESYLNYYRETNNLLRTYLDWYELKVKSQPP